MLGFAVCGCRVAGYIFAAACRKHGPPGCSL